MIYRELGFLALLFLYGSPPPLPSVGLTGDTEEYWETTCWRLREKEGWGRSQIIRRQESLVLYKSFNTLCTKHFAHVSEANDLYRYYQNVCTPGEPNKKKLNWCEVRSYFVNNQAAKNKKKEKSELVLYVRVQLCVVGLEGLGETHWLDGSQRNQPSFRL